MPTHINTEHLWRRYGGPTIVRRETIWMSTLLTSKPIKSDPQNTIYISVIHVIGCNTTNVLSISLSSKMCSKSFASEFLFELLVAKKCPQSHIFWYQRATIGLSRTNYSKMVTPAFFIFQLATHVYASHNWQQFDSHIFTKRETIWVRIPLIPVQLLFCNMSMFCIVLRTQGTLGYK